MAWCGSVSGSAVAMPLSAVWAAVDLSCLGFLGVPCCSSVMVCLGGLASWTLVVAALLGFLTLSASAVLASDWALVGVSWLGCGGGSGGSGCSPWGAASASLGLSGGAWRPSLLGRRASFRLGVVPRAPLLRACRGVADSLGVWPDLVGCLPGPASCWGRLIGGSWFLVGCLLGPASLWEGRCCSFPC